MGHARASEVLLAGRKITAVEARDFGLVRVAPLLLLPLLLHCSLDRAAPYLAVVVVGL